MTSHGGIKVAAAIAAAGFGGVALGYILFAQSKAPVSRHPAGSAASSTSAASLHVDRHSPTPHEHSEDNTGDVYPVVSAVNNLAPSTHGFAPVIIGVAGASGSGKTSIAELIAARLHGGRVLSISSDNYYKTLNGQDPAHYNFDHPDSIDFPMLAGHLEMLRRGEDVEVPHYDFATHRRTGATTHVCAKETTVIIVDGIFVLWAKQVADQCDLTIFCSEDSDVCLARRLRRDLVERQRTVESVLTQYLRFVKTGFDEFVRPSSARASLIIPRARENAVAIDMLARDIQQRVDRQRPPASVVPVVAVCPT